MQKNWDSYTMSWNESHVCLYILIVTEKNFDAFFYDLEYTKEKLVVSHSYESHFHVGQPRHVLHATQKFTTTLFPVY